MPGYENGKQTYQKIMDATRSLFWEKGYTDTRFEDYYRQYGIRTGLVHYHFQKKEQLALVLYREIAQDVTKLIEALVPQNQPLLHYTMLFHIMWDYYANCPEYARFVREALEIRVHATAIKEPSVLWYRAINTQYALGLSETQLQIRALATVGGQVEIIHAYLSGELDLNASELAEYDVTNALQMLGIPANEIAEALVQAKALAESHHFAMTEGFRPSIMEI